MICSLSGLDAADTSGSVCTNLWVSSRVADGRMEAGSYSQRTASHAQVLTSFLLHKYLSHVDGSYFYSHRHSCFHLAQEVEADQGCRHLCAAATEGGRSWVGFIAQQ